MLNIYTDGSCLKNPGGAIGFAAVFVLDNKVVNYVTGALESGTNNQAELLAAIKALKLVKPNQEVTIYSDSQYVVQGMTIYKPSRLGKKKVIPNLDLWTQLDDLASGKLVTWQWIKGHSGNKYNEMADKLANHQALTI
jgi:ribonuclease HI